MFFLDIVDLHLLLVAAFGVVGSQPGGFFKGTVWQLLGVLHLYHHMGAWDLLGVEPPVISVGKLEGELVILVIVLAHIDVESVTADIMKGLAGDFLLFGAALFADVAASHQFFFDLYQVLLMEGNVQGRGDGLQMVNLLFHLPCQFRQDFVGALQLPVSVKIFFGIFRGT